MEERSILRTWAMRGTVHLIATEDYGWLGPLYAERIAAGSNRRLLALGVSDGERDRALAAIRAALESQGRLTRGEAMEIAARSGLEVTVERRTQLSTLLVVEGSACIGPDAGRESMFAATREWIGEPQRRGREESLAELARRYVDAFAPATERDFAAWAGLPLRDCRLGLERIAADLDEVRVGEEAALVPRGWRARVQPAPLVRLLPAFDTYLMGYASRAHAAAPEDERRVLPGGGVLRPTVCVDGRFVGLWSSKRSGRRLAVSIEPFDGFEDAWTEAIAAEVADLGRFEDVEATLL